MRRGRARACLGAAGFEEDDGLELGDLLRDLDEPFAVNHVLDIAEDEARILVAHEVLDKVDLRKVGLVPQADELREPHVVPDGPVHDRDAHGAGLGEEADRAFRQHVRSKGGVHIICGVDKTEAVRPQDADVLLPADLFKFFFEKRAASARFLESRADDNGRRDARCRALTERCGNEFCGDDDDRQIDGLSDIRYVCVHLEPQDLAARRVDRIQRAPELEPQEIVQYCMPDFLRVRGRADDGNGIGVEKAFEHHSVSLDEKQQAVKRERETTVAVHIRTTAGTAHLQYFVIRISHNR